MLHFSVFAVQLGVAELFVVHLLQYSTVSACTTPAQCYLVSQLLPDVQAVVGRQAVQYHRLTPRHLRKLFNYFCFCLQIIS